MLAAPVCDNEPARLNALQRYSIMDTAFEKVFDDVVRMASKVCGTPIALVSLVDADRQWFKARVGLGATETSRDVSFCGHAIHGTELFEVPDAWEDARFHDNPLVTGGPNVRFYAGAPLRTSDGHGIGTLCVIDSLPHALDDHQRDVLRALADHVMELMELRLATTHAARDDVYLRTLLSNLAEGVLVVNGARKVVDHNDAACRILGASPSEFEHLFTENRGWEFFRRDGTLLQKNELPWERTAVTLAPHHETNVCVRFPQRATLWLNVSSSPLSVEKGREEILVTFSDVTALREHQHAMTQDAKMKALGEMAGGVAHEINNPLAIIGGFAAMLSQSLADAGVPQELYAKKLDRIIATSERIASIVRGMRLLSRSAEHDAYVKTDLALVARESLSMCAERFREAGIALKIQFDEGAMVSGSPTQISQVLVNLLNNAFDAVSSLDVRWVRVEVVAGAGVGHLAGAHVLRVTDSGQGIPRELLDKLMQPFFTTKGPGRGTGLGLSVSKGLIESHGGALRYEEVDGHTSFCVELPCVEVAGESSLRVG
jgi:two-component system NtrC family sensor kinase